MVLAAHVAQKFLPGRPAGDHQVATRLLPILQQFEALKSWPVVDRTQSLGEGAAERSGSIDGDRDLADSNVGRSDSTFYNELSSLGERNAEKAGRPANPKRADQGHTCGAKGLEHSATALGCCIWEH